MDGSAIERIVSNSESLKRWSRQFARKRYLYGEAAGISREYYVGIAGMRGIGKTVMLLQMADAAKDSVYLSADASHLMPFSLYEIADALSRQGFGEIFIDEIHARDGWARDVKTLYDEHRVRLVFSGSSAMRIRDSGADLSRRAVILGLLPVSFREYLSIRRGIELPRRSLDGIIREKRRLCTVHAGAAGFLPEYLSSGGVLYSGAGFGEALQNSLEKMVTKDLAPLRSISAKYENDAYRLLYHIAASKPFEFSYSSVSQKLGISKSLLIRMLSDLQAIGLVKALLPCARGGVDVKKEPKVYIAIPYRSLLCEKPDIGAMREEFFALHASPSCYLKTARGEKTADFRAGGKVIEVGGMGKGSGQSPDVIASDGMRMDGKHVPLFLFGLLY
jgi:predicted AAA+ superfamily ATPase